MSQVSAGLRFKVLQRDSFRCVYCGKTGQEAELHVDHLYPNSHGGRSEIDNLITACLECNAGKSNGLVVDIPEHIEKQLRQQIKQYAMKNCEAPGCLQTFSQTRPWRRFCSKRCQFAAWAARHPRIK